MLNSFEELVLEKELIQKSFENNFEKDFEFKYKNNVEVFLKDFILNHLF